MGQDSSGFANFHSNLFNGNKIFFLRGGGEGGIGIGSPVSSSQDKNSTSIC